MAFIEALRERLGHQYQHEYKAVICECRHCGTKTEPGTEVCPTCGATEIARYDLQ